jgi:uncharacterized protein YktA (UPF0223 family)
MATYEEVNKIVNFLNNCEYCFDKQILIQDILQIVNNGKKYPDRGGTEELRFPEDFSTSIANQYFNVDAYPTKGEIDKQNKQIAEIKKKQYEEEQIHINKFKASSRLEKLKNINNISPNCKGLF